MCISVQVIDPFPRPTKNMSINQQQQKPFLADANNCDIDFLRKSSNPTATAAAAVAVTTTTNTTTMKSTSDSSDTATSNSTSSTQQQQQYNETMRDNVMKELLETEENYVKLLSSICLGYGNLILNNSIHLFSFMCVRVRGSKINRISGNISFLYLFI